ncbi:MAG: hypothetical protein K940chlam3_00107 [Chlamydiae bacterium]|nr:hypothetical protein [Chlamydiota bacterium]
MQLILCSQCGLQIHRSPYQIARSSIFFCSNKCHTLYKYGPETIKKRFLSKIEKQSDGCWLWKGVKNRKGYGQFGIDSKMLSCHRVSWKLYRGELPAGVHVLHKCDVRNCVNPDHLFLGTNKDNVIDSVHKGRRSQGIQHFRAKLNPDKVRTIRKMFRSDKFLKIKIARHFEVAVGTIKAVLDGITWKHVE